MKKEYTGFRLLLDLVLTLVTGGLWLIILLLIHLGNARK
jgi:hypothetical protein